MRSIYSIFLTLLSVTLIGNSAWSATPETKKKAEEPYADEILSGPFSEYGDFDSSEDEAEDERFFQSGRFFGVGFGAGTTSATGNAGRIYQGGFPTVDLRLLYWFDFHFAFQMTIQNSRHNYDLQPDGLTDVNFFRALAQVKYFFETKDLAAPITFVSPHLIFGGGYYQRTDNVGSGTGDETVRTIDTKNAVGFNFGGGLELTLKPKKTYLDFEFLMHLVQFDDQYDPKFRGAGISDRTGTWLSAGLALVWTW